MSSMAILIPVVVIAWLSGLALILALCVMSARSDRETAIAMRRARGGERGRGRRRRGLAL
jgi:hypothetical protein